VTNFNAAEPILQYVLCAILVLAFAATGDAETISGLEQSFDTWVLKRSKLAGSVFVPAHVQTFKFDRGRFAFQAGKREAGCSTGSNSLEWYKLKGKA